MSPFAKSVGFIILRRTSPLFLALILVGSMNAFASSDQLSYTETFQHKTARIGLDETIVGTGDPKPEWFISGSKSAHAQVTKPGELSVSTTESATVTVGAVDLLPSRGASDFDVSHSPLTVVAVISASGTDSSNGMLSVGIVMGGLNIETWPDYLNGRIERVISKDGIKLIDDHASPFSAISGKPFSISAEIVRKDNDHYRLDYSFGATKHRIVIARADIAAITSVGIHLEDRKGGTVFVKSFSVSQPVVPAFDPMAGLESAQGANITGAAALRLIPFPKSVELHSGGFPLNCKLTMEAPAATASLLGHSINEELERAGFPGAEIRSVAGKTQSIRLYCKTGTPLPETAFRNGATAEDYTLAVTDKGVVCNSPGEAGLHYAAETLKQLIRCNLQDKRLPCLAIRDWPSLRWRAFQDDMTRGPSANLATLERGIQLGHEFKMNLVTYYMEFQYAFQKHADIGPKDGSLTPEELKTLVAYSGALHLDILGCQQSFGHMGGLLSHPEYASIRETADILSPAKEESYSILNDLYSEVAPLLPFPWFNVCCDETSDLDTTTGPAMEMVKKLGPGPVYAGHMRRLHDILKAKYGKRMVMWGDIILTHPDDLAKIPADTIMLTWEYKPLAKFDSEILPFVKAGYDFFVCPGVEDWGRILPDFGAATINIQNFVRDGVKYHALGMLNTEWKDDACTLRSTAWPGYAWGAECAWNASSTTPEDFNRRLGGVLFGEKGNHFGQAINLLSKTFAFINKTENIPRAMDNARFWKSDIMPAQSETTIRGRTKTPLVWIRLAIEQLEACKKEARVNADLLDAFLLGARRMELLEQRRIDGIEASRTYAEALASTDKSTRLAKLAAVEQLAIHDRDAHCALGKEFERLWRLEDKPYALKRTMDKFAVLVKSYDDLAAKAANAQKLAEAGSPLPTATQLGLAMEDPAE